MWVLQGKGSHPPCLSSRLGNWSLPAQGCPACLCTPSQSTSLLSPLLTQMTAVVGHVALLLTELFSDTTPSLPIPHAIKTPLSGWLLSTCLFSPIPLSNRLVHPPCCWWSSLLCSLIWKAFPWHLPGWPWTERRSGSCGPVRKYFYQHRT